MPLFNNLHEIHKEPYWASIQNCFHLCVSQTLVNGLCEQYKEFYKGKLTTVTKFINTLYEDWQSDSITISQRASIDNLIECMNFSSLILAGSIPSSNIVRTLSTTSLLFRLSEDIISVLSISFTIVEKLSYDQKCIVEIYKELILTNNKFFKIKENFEKKEIDTAIENTIQDVSRGKCDSKKIRKDSIIVHGIHQFTPIMLKMIFDSNEEYTSNHV